MPFVAASGPLSERPSALRLLLARCGAAQRRVRACDTRPVASGGGAAAEGEMRRWAMWAALAAVATVGLSGCQAMAPAHGDSGSGATPASSAGNTGGDPLARLSAALP